MFLNIQIISLSNQKGTTQPILIYLNPNKYIEVLLYYPFVVNVDRWIGIVILLTTYLVNYAFQTKQKI